jgi:hypothetical protein
MHFFNYNTMIQCWHGMSTNMHGYPKDLAAPVTTGIQKMLRESNVIYYDL